jgi:hypothetical protein
LAREKQSFVMNSAGSTFCAGMELDVKTQRHDAGVILALARTHASLEQFCSQAVQESPITFDLPIRQYGVFKGLIQQQYELHRRVEAGTYNLRLNFSLQRVEKGVFEYFQADKDTSFLACLRKDGVKVLASRVVGLNTDSQRVLFELEGKVPVQLEFKADVRAGSVALCLSNFDMLGTRCYVLKPEQITDEFLHQLGLFILRRHNSFLKETLVVNSYEPVRDDDQTSCNPILSEIEVKSADILEFEVAELFVRKKVILRYHDREQLFDSRRAACHIGRKYPADIIIRSRFASRDHATLGLHDNRFLLHDHSRNGIYIKPAGRKMIHVHNTQYRLDGRGVFCVGETVHPNHPDLVSYEVT